MQLRSVEVSQFTGFLAKMKITLKEIFNQNAEDHKAIFDKLGSIAVIKYMAGASMTISLLALTISLRAITGV